VVVGVVVVVVVVVVAAAVVVVVRVIFAHSYSKNSHERAEEVSHALLKSSVLSIDGEMQRQTVLVVAK